MTIAAVKFVVTLIFDPHGERIVIFAFLNPAVLLWNTDATHLITHESFVTSTSLVTGTIVSVTPATTAFGFIAPVHAIAKVFTVGAPWTIGTVVLGDTKSGGVITSVSRNTFASGFTGFRTVFVLAVTFVIGVTAVSLSTTAAARVPLFIFTTGWSAHFFNGDTVAIVAPCESRITLTSTNTATIATNTFFPTCSIPIATKVIETRVTTIVPGSVFTTLDRCWNQTACFFVSHTSFSRICWDHSGWTFALWNTLTSATHFTTAIATAIRTTVKVRTSAATIIPGHHSRTLMTTWIVLTTVARFDTGTMLISDVSEITDAH